MEAQRAILTTATAVARHTGELGRETKAPAALTKVTAAAPHLLGFVPVYFAAQINFKSAASQGPEWANFAVISTILTAILFETYIAGHAAHVSLSVRCDSPGASFLRHEHARGDRERGVG